MSQETPATMQEPPLAPYLTVEGGAAAIDFYTRAFGAIELTRQLAPNGKIMHAALLINGAVVMLSDDFPEMAGGVSRSPRALGGSPVVIHLTLGDVDRMWEQAVAAGAEVTMPLADQFWGSRYGMLRDPFGHGWSLSTPMQPRSEEEMRAGMEQAFAQPA